MRVVSKHWLRGLLLTGIYLLGILGIVASGSGSGGGSNLDINGVFISVKESPTYESTIRTLGYFDYSFSSGGDNSETVKISWRNDSTGESSSEKRLFGTGTYCALVIFCGLSYDNDNSLALPISLALGNNEIKVTVKSDGSKASSSVLVERKPADASVLPYLETLPPSAINGNSATLEAIVNPRASFSHGADVWFEYSTDSGLTPVNSTTAKLLYGENNIAFTEWVSNLLGDTTYYYRVVARNKFGTQQGDTLNFKTKGPSVVTSPAIQLFPKEATLSGSANPNGFDTDTWFQLGFDPVFAAYETTSPLLSMEAGNAFIPVDHLFDQLSTGTKYYYRLSASNVWGTSSGDTLNFTTPLAGETCWAKKYSPYLGSITQDYADIHSIEKTSDGGYIITARAYHDLSNLIIKTNSEGGIEWSKAFPRDEGTDPGTYPYYSNAQPAVTKEISIGRYIVVGEIAQWAMQGVTQSMSWVAELDMNGGIVWQKTYGLPIGAGGGNLRVPKIEVLSDGFIFTGKPSSGGDPGHFRVLRLDQAGNIVWQYTYGGILSQNEVEIGVVADGYILVGSTASYGAGYSDIWVIKLDHNGNIVWQKTYGSVDDESAIDASISNDGITIAGNLRPLIGSGIFGSSKMWVFDLANDGSINWQTTTNGRARGIKQTEDGGVILSSLPAHYSKLDNMGSVEWGKGLPGYSLERAYGTLLEASEGGYIIAANTTTPNSQNINIIKTDVSGSCPPLDLDGSKTTVATNIVPQLTTIAPMLSDWLVFSPNSQSLPANQTIDAYLGIEQTAP
jgi:hypothetical protein